MPGPSKGPQMGLSSHRQNAVPASEVATVRPPDPPPVLDRLSLLEQQIVECFQNTNDMASNFNDRMGALEDRIAHLERAVGGTY